MLTREDGTVDLDVLLGVLRCTERELALALNVSQDSLSEHPRLKDLVEILTAAAPWSGSIQQAVWWFFAEPLPSLNDRTAAELVRTGRGQLVRSYLRRIAAGGYA